MTSSSCDCAIGRSEDEVDIRKEIMDAEISSLGCQLQNILLITK